MAENHDKYLLIVAWARRRYTHNGRIVTHIGSVPSQYTRIEDLAAERYLGCARRFQ